MLQKKFSQRRFLVNECIVKLLCYSEISREAEVCCTYGKSLKNLCADCYCCLSSCFFYLQCMKKAQLQRPQYATAIIQLWATETIFDTTVQMTLDDFLAQMSKWSTKWAVQKTNSSSSTWFLSSIFATTLEHLERKTLRLLQIIPAVIGRGLVNLYWLKNQNKAIFHFSQMPP